VAAVAVVAAAATASAPRVVTDLRRNVTLRPVSRSVGRSERTVASAHSEKAIDRVLDALPQLAA
jgi:hypothetical protein